jgi:hypothetical protein
VKTSQFQRRRRTSDTAHGARRRFPLRPMLEVCENRMLLATVTVNLSNGLLVVTGSEYSDTIHLLTSGANTVVNYVTTNQGALVDSGTYTEQSAQIKSVQIDGGNGDDTLDASGYSGPVTLNAGSGNNALMVGSGNATVNGGSGTNTLFASGDTNFTLTNSSLVGLGTDTLTSIQNVNLTATGSDAHTLDVSGSNLSGKVTLNGGAGNNTFIVGPGQATINGGGGTNTLKATGDTNFKLTDLSLVGLGTDTLNSIQDAILTATGNDAHTLDASGFSGSVTLSAGSGNDTLVGGAGPDVFNGGPGGDVMDLLSPAQKSAGARDVVNPGAGSDNVQFVGPFTLQLMFGLNDAGSIPTTGTNLIILGEVNNGQGGDVLHFRIFDANGNKLVDTDESQPQLHPYATAIANLKTLLQSLQPPHVLTASETAEVETAVSAIVGVGDYSITGSFLQTWLANHGEAGVFGVPTDDALPGTVGVISQRFGGGLIYDSPATGPLVVPYALPAEATALFSDNPAAYEAQRVNLLKYFFYNGFIAERIKIDQNNPNQDDIIFGDDTYHMGEALLMFSQEATILQDGGLDPTPSENVIAIILNGFDQLQSSDAVNSLFHGSVAAQPGFFLRDYVAQTSQELRQGIPGALDIPIAAQDGTSALRTVSIESDYGSNDPVSDVMSEDQVALFMNGLWAVTRYSTSASNIDKAREDANNIITYLMSVHYHITINGATPMGGDMSVAAGYLSEMADAITGNDYFSRQDNSISLGVIDANSISNLLTNAVEVALSGALGALGAVATGIWAADPHVVSEHHLIYDLIEPAVKSVLGSYSKPVYLPVSIEQGLLLAGEAATGPFDEFVLTGTISLAQYLPPEIQEAFSQPQFSIPWPTGFSPGSVYQPVKQVGNAITGYYNIPDGLPQITLPHVTTKYITLQSLLGGISITPFPGGVPNPKSGGNLINLFAKHLAFVEMAYDPTTVTDGLYLPLTTANLSLLSDTPDDWAALLRSDVLGRSVAPEVLNGDANQVGAVQIAQSAPVNAPTTNNVAVNDPFLLWATKDRWETGSEWESGEVNFTGNDFRTIDPPSQFSGIDFLSLETLIQVTSRGLHPTITGGSNIPGVAVVPNAQNSAFNDLQVYGAASIKAITLKPVGGGVEVYFDGVLQGSGPFFPTGEIWVHGGSGDKTITVDGDLGLPTNLFGDTGNDTFAVIGGAGSGVSVAGGSGSCTLVGDDLPMIWTIDGHNSGRLDNGVLFSGVGNLVGGSAADDFVFDSGASLSGNIDGKDGGNALDFTADPGQGIVLTAEGAIGGFDGTDTNTNTLAGQFSNISEIVGSSAPSEDGLSGLNTAATWVVTPAASTYTVNADGRSLSFLGFGVLNGIAGGSTFDIQGTGFPLTINGNAGSDVFDVSSSAGTNAVGDLNAIGGTLTINAGPGRANRLILDDTTDGTAHANVMITSGAVRNLAPSEIDYTAAGGGSFDDATGADGLLIQGPAMGSTFNVQGTLGEGSTTEIVGGGDQNTFNVGSTAPGTDGIVDTIQGLLTTDGSGADTMNVDDTGSSTFKTGTLTEGQLTGLGMGPEGVAYSGIAVLNVNLGSGGNQFAINVAGGTNLPATTTIDGGTSNSDSLGANWAGDFNGLLDLFDFESSTITVGGNFNGAMTDIAPGDVRSVSVAGSVTGPASLLAGSIDNISVGQDIAGQVQSLGQIGLLTVGTVSYPGSVTGNVEAIGDIGNALVYGVVAGRITAGDNFEAPPKQPGAPQQILAPAKIDAVQVMGDVSGTVMASASIGTATIGSPGYAGSVMQRGLVQAGLDIANIQVYGNISGIVQAAGTIGTMTVGGSVLPTLAPLAPGSLLAGIIRATNVDTLTIGGAMSGFVTVSTDLDNMWVGQDLAGAVNVGQTLGQLTVLGGTPGAIISRTIGTVGTYGGYGAVVAQIKENGIERRLEAAVPGVPYPQPIALFSDPASAATHVSPAGVNFQYLYEGLASNNGTLANPQLTLRVSNNTGNTSPDQFDVSLVTWSDRADFNLARLDAGSGINHGVSGIRNVDIEGNLLSTVTPAAEAFFSLPSAIGGIRLPQDRVASVAVRDHADAGAVTAASIRGLAFGSLTSGGTTLTGAAANSAYASQLLAPGTAIVQAGTVNPYDEDVFRVPFDDQRGQGVAFFMDDTRYASLDGAAVDFVDEGSETSTGDPRGTVTALLTVNGPVLTNTNSSFILAVDLAGDGGSLATAQPILSRITSTGPLGDLTVLSARGISANVTAPSIIGSIITSGPISGTIQTTGVRTDMTTDFSSPVPADFGRTIAAGPGNVFGVTTVTTAQGQPIVGKIVSRGNLISQINAGGGISGAVASQGDIGGMLDSAGGKVVRFGGVRANGDLSGDVVALGNIVGDINIAGNLTGRIAANGQASPYFGSGGILGDINVLGSAGTAKNCGVVISRGEIGDANLKTGLTVTGGLTNGIFAAEGPITVLNQGNPSPAFILGDVSDVPSDPNAVAIDSVFESTSGQPIMLFDKRSPLDLANLSQIIGDLATLHVVKRPSGQYVLSH